MTLKEEYQAKVDRIKKLLAEKEYDDTMKENLEHMKDIYENRIESIENVAKEKKAREARDKAREGK